MRARKLFCSFVTLRFSFADDDVSDVQVLYFTQAALYTRASIIAEQNLAAANSTDTAEEQRRKGNLHVQCMRQEI
jgi:hypothetical protein